jgi:flagellar basal-body rod protein FlgB
MSNIQLFDLASRHATWLAARQGSIAGNVANANTPGFRATDIEAFSATLDQTKLTMATTQAGHVADARAAAYRVDEIQGQSWETQHSGNSVSLEQEMIKAGEVKGAFSLNTAVVKSFHRMLLMSSKG